jgi:hypothetical protein
MIVTLIQGFIIYILIVMIIRHLKPLIEHFNKNDYNYYNEFKNDIENDNKKDSKNKKFHTQDALNSTPGIFKTKNPFPSSPDPQTFKKEIVEWENAIPLFGSIDIDVRMRGASNRRGIPDLGTYDCQNVTFKKNIKKTAPAAGSAASVSYEETDLEEIDSTTNKTLEQCANACHKEKKCKGFKYSKKSKKCILTKGIKIIKGTNDNEYNLSKCLNRNKVYVYDEYGNLNKEWSKKGEYIYYPKIEQKSECVDLDNNQFFRRNCKSKPCYKIPEGVLNQCIEQSEISSYKELQDPADLSKCGVGKRIDSKSRPRKCLKCDAGTYSDKEMVSGRPEWASECLKCKPGTYNNKKGLARCEPCKKGSARSDKEDSTKCAHCPYNKIASAEGAKTCTECTGGKVASADRTQCLDLLRSIQTKLKAQQVKMIKINIQQAGGTGWHGYREKVTDPRQQLSHFMDISRGNANTPVLELPSETKSCCKNSVVVKKCRWRAKSKATLGQWLVQGGNVKGDGCAVTLTSSGGWDTVFGNKKVKCGTSTANCEWKNETGTGPGVSIAHFLFPFSKGLNTPLPKFKIKKINNDECLTTIGLKNPFYTNYKEQKTWRVSGGKIKSDDPRYPPVKIMSIIKQPDEFVLAAIKDCNIKGDGNNKIIPAIFIPSASAEFNTKIYTNNDKITIMTATLEPLGLIYKKTKDQGCKCRIKGLALRSGWSTGGLYYLCMNTKLNIYEWKAAGSSKAPPSSAEIFDITY